MTDRERILAMVDDGKISRPEADRLLAVLADIDDVDQSMRRVDEEAQATDPATDPATDVADPDPETAPSGHRDERTPGGAFIPGATGAAVADKVTRAIDAIDKAIGTGVSGATGNPATSDASRDTHAEPIDYPADLRWLRINMLAGDLDIRVDDSLDMPVLESDSGHYQLERDGDDYILSQFGGNEGEGWLDRLIGGFRQGDLDLKIPSRFGVHLDMKAGDVSIEQVAYLRGHLLAGDLSAHAHGVDLTMSAGDLKLELRPTRGRHRLSVSAGDVKIALVDGSSVSVDGRISIGDTSLPDGFERHRHGLGQRFSGTVGGGEAELELKLSTGDLKVSTPHG